MCHLEHNAAPVSAEDMVARAMAFTANYGEAATAGTLQRGGAQQAIVGDAAAPLPTTPVLLDQAASVAATAPTQQGGESDGEVSDSGDDDTVDMELGVLEDETADQHKARVRKLLKEKLQRSRAARAAREERRANKGRDNKDPKDKPRPKPTLKK